MVQSGWPAAVLPASYTRVWKAALLGEHHVAMPHAPGAAQPWCYTQQHTRWHGHLPASDPPQAYLPHAYTTCSASTTTPSPCTPPTRALLPCHPQRLRFQTSLLFTACISCEFLTPFFPQHFLLLASIANVGKAVGLTTFIATGPAFQQALCSANNLADITAKTQVGGRGRMTCCCMAPQGLRLARTCVQ